MNSIRAIDLVLRSSGAFIFCGGFEFNLASHGTLSTNWRILEPREIRHRERHTQSMNRLIQVQSTS
jgi:hypothetical protein